MLAKFSVREILSSSFTAVRDNYSFFFSLMVGLFLLSAPSYIYGYIVDEDGLNMMAPLWLSIVSLVVMWFLQILTQVGQITIVLAQQKGTRLPLSTLIHPNRNHMVQFFGGSILYGLIVLAGFILLIIPGIVWGIKYSQWMYLVVDENLSAVEAIKKSGEITNGNKLNLIGFGFILGLISILAVLPLGLGLLLVIPMYWVASIKIYQFLNNTDDVLPAGEDAL